MKTGFCVFLVLGVASCVSQAQTPASAYGEPAALAKLVVEKTEPYILVDVRTPEEYSAGHIPTAVNIPVSTIAKQLPTEDRKALIIVYCASGRRSSTAKATLDSLGFTRVVNFGPVSRWEGDLAIGDSPGGDESQEGDSPAGGESPGG